ncbi:MAG: hypothetical protein KDA37_09895, partial [Planctomycetales bacterium]|nr:hypothetical protein [Planctomycetales bacterium]
AREALIVRADCPRHMERLREWLGTTSMPLTAHNASFDIRVLVNAAIAGHKALWDRMIDTYILDVLMRPGDGWTRPEHGLKPATAAWCGGGATAADAKEGMQRWWRGLGLKTETAGWRECPADGLPYLLYGAADVFDGVTLAGTLLPLVDSMLGRDVREREHTIARLVHGITMRGLRVDVEAAAAAAESAEVDVEALRDRLTSRYGVANPASNPQVQSWFARVLGAAPISTSAEELLALDLDGEPAAFRSDLLAWRERGKLLSTYLRMLAATPADADGAHRLHPTFGTLDARTGRFASRDPNVQNFPADMRKFVVAEPGMTLIDADFSAVEVRIAAAFAEDAALTETFRSGGDPYAAAAEAAWGAAPDAATAKANRTRAKPLLLGHIYGRGPKKIATALGITIAEARVLQQRMTAAMPDMPRYIAAARGTAAGGDGATRITGGRVVQVHPCTQFNSSVNSIVQGSGRELLVDALLALEAAGLGDSLWLPVHDEWVLQVPESDADALCALLAEAMTRQVGAVPIVAEAKVMGREWQKL